MTSKKTHNFLNSYPLHYSNSELRYYVSTSRDVSWQKSLVPDNNTIKSIIIVALAILLTSYLNNRWLYVLTYVLTYLQTLGQVLEKLRAQEEPKSLPPAHQMPFLGSKYAKIAFAAGALPQTPLGELTALPQTPSWI